MAKIHISRKHNFGKAISIELPYSKSIANRYLILNTIAKGIAFTVAESRDCQLLQKALQSPANLCWFEDGATPARFFMAYACATDMKVTIDGTEGLRKRSVLELVNALTNAGAEITWKGEKGFLPVFIEKGIPGNTANFHIDRSMSSQFVSALMLASPALANPFTIHLTGKANSDSYIRLTALCMEDFGIHTEIHEDRIEIEHRNFKRPEKLIVESDWTSASYFFELCALHPNSSFLLQNLSSDNKQEDAALVPFFEQLGVKSTFVPEGLLIQNHGACSISPNFDLKNNIDTAPALICSCAALGLEATFTGIENLVFKESNRIEAINANLKHWGWMLEKEANLWQLKRLEQRTDGAVTIRTFSDHRIAMAFAILADSKELEIDDVTCVEKSFPQFWNELRKCNFVIEDVAE